MKRLCILLAALLVLPLCACTAPEADPSADGSSAVPSAPPSESSGSDAVCEAALEIDALLAGGAPDRTQVRKNVLAGKTYTLSRPAGSGDDYADPEGKKLTDGAYAEQFNTYSWTGFAGGTPVAVDFDLGDDAHGISDIEIGCLRQMEYGIGLAGSVTLYASADGESYTSLGAVYMPASPQDPAKFTYAFRLDETLKARYIRLAFSKQEAGWFFIDEISAYAYSADNAPEQGTVAQYYGDPTVPASEPSYWPETDADYDETLNLALGAEHIYVQHFSELEPEDAVPSLNTPDPAVLIDGTRAGVSWSGADTFRMTRGDGRRITIDLGHISAVERVAFDLLILTAWGVYPVGEVGVLVSENGADWQSVATVWVDYGDKTAEMLRFTADLGGVRRARYVCLLMQTKGHAAMSEIEVYGTKRVPDSALPVEPERSVENALSDRYPAPEDFGGIENILCTPICRGDGSSYDEGGMITAEEFARYVGYYENGAIQDTFFDTFLFSPCADFAPAAERITLKGWRFYIDSQFVADRNLDALNTAVGSAKDALNRADYQAKVFLSILRPTPQTADGQVNTFGDLDGDGVDDPLNTLENRQKAVKWQIDTQLARYRSAGYENLSLVGFYWQEEHIFGDDPDERAVVRYATDYVHALGLKMLWIPYYQAQEFEEWKSLGFDIACLQPNYSFMSVTDPDRLDSTALQARMFGMCVEMELSAWSNRLNIERYKQYIRKGVEYGYMDSIKVYYLGVIPTDLTQALDNGDDYAKSVYKDTYLYAKGRLDESYSALPEAAEVTAPQSAEYACDGRAFTGKIEVDSDDLYTVTLAVSPRYGSLRLDADGSFTYYPLQGYTGADSFRVTAVYGDSVSEEAVISFVCS